MPGEKNNDLQERRLKKRVPVDFPPEITVRYKDKIYHGEPVDIGKGGACILLPVHVKPYTNLMLVWEMKGLGVVKIDAQVRWCKKEGLKYKAGLEFQVVRK
jgi:hypothetical protein